jgi:hypothetical protein
MKMVRGLLVALVVCALALPASGLLARADVAGPSGRSAAGVSAPPQQLPSNGLILFTSSRSGHGTTQLYTMYPNVRM